jgi:hypothetical protein
VKDESQIEEMRAAVRGDRERAEAKKREVQGEAPPRPRAPKPRGLLSRLARRA